MFTLTSMVAAGTAMQENQIAAPAFNLMEQAENMPVERQRRFWVIFFLKIMNEKLILFKGCISSRGWSLCQRPPWWPNCRTKCCYCCRKLAQRICSNVCRTTKTILGKICLVSHQRKLIFKGALAHAAGHFARGLLGDQTASPGAQSAAENLHNAYAAMSEKRQRRFWVRFFL